jgi:hypothetical protein
MARMNTDDIAVTPRTDGGFDVEIRHASVITQHLVTIPAGFSEEFGWQQGDTDLVKASFEFLLAREPATSILESFSLDVIARYFPDYPSEMRRLASF